MGTERSAAARRVGVRGARRAGRTADGDVPLLAVEVGSRTTATGDRIRTRSAYARLGVRSYWLVDLDRLVVMVLELQDGRYVETARATGDEAVTVTMPFAVSFRAVDLLHRRRS